MIGLRLAIAHQLQKAYGSIWRIHIVASVLRFIFSNFMFTCLILGLLASAVALQRTPKPKTRARIAEALLSYYVLFSIGIGMLYNFVLHSFFGSMTACFIGWPDSPFQAEVGFASLGFAVVGFLAFRRSFDLRLAAVIGPAIFLLSAAIGHIYQIVTAHNFAPGNAGLTLYMDILTPLFGFALLWMSARNPIVREQKT
jgi:hypothetical protein